ncbi:MAG: hydrogenase maturation protease [Actinomycetota bacterium]
MLIIGCGTRERGDDAAGLLVAERLRELESPAAGVAIQLCSGEASELIDLWSTDDEVIVVDAVVGDAPAGTIHRWQDDIPAGVGSGSASTHGFGLREAIPLAQIMDRLPGFLCIYGIEARVFETGADVSPEVRQAVEQAAQEISRLLKTLHTEILP